MHCTIAFDNATHEHVLPRLAMVRSLPYGRYVCPRCDKNTALCVNADTAEPYFTHQYADDHARCMIRPHDVAKWTLRAAIIAGIKITIRMFCCARNHQYDVVLPPYDATSMVNLEHPIIVDDPHWQRYADVAFLPCGYGGPQHVIEVFHTHRTAESARIEPWYEIADQDILDQAKQNNIDWMLMCKRKGHRCPDCILRDPHIKPIIEPPAVQKQQQTFPEHRQRFRWCWTCKLLFPSRGALEAHSRTCNMPRIVTPPPKEEPLVLTAAEPSLDDPLYQWFLQYQH